MLNYFNRNKWWAIAFVILLVMNVATLASLWMIKEKLARSGNQPPPEVAGFLVKELGFDSLQKEKLLILRSAHQQKMDELRANTRYAKDALFALLQQPGISDSALEKAVYTASENDRQMDMITFRHFEQIRALCTPAQKPKFDKVIKEVIRIMAPPMGSRHPGGPPPGDGRQGPIEGGPPPPGEGREQLPPPQQ